MRALCFASSIPLAWYSLRALYIMFGGLLLCYPKGLELDTIFAQHEGEQKQKKKSGDRER